MLRSTLFEVERKWLHQRAIIFFRGNFLLSLSLSVSLICSLSLFLPPYPSLRRWHQTPTPAFYPVSRSLAFIFTPHWSFSEASDFFYLQQPRRKGISELLPKVSKDIPFHTKKELRVNPLKKRQCNWGVEGLTLLADLG